MLDLSTAFDTLDHNILLQHLYVTFGNSVSSSCRHHIFGCSFEIWSAPRICSCASFIHRIYSATWFYHLLLWPAVSIVCGWYTVASIWPCFPPPAGLHHHTTHSRLCKSLEVFWIQLFELVFPWRNALYDPITIVFCIFPLIFYHFFSPLWLCIRPTEVNWMGTMKFIFYKYSLRGKL